MKVNTLLIEMIQETEKSKVESIPKKDPECLVEILKKMNEAKK